MALNASVTGRHVIHLRRIDDIAARGVRHVLAAGTVASLAADIPFSYLLGVNVVPDRMTAIAKRTCRPVEVVTRIERSPPVASGWRHLIFAPFLVYDFPLHRQRKIIVADLREVSLLPNTAVNERHLIF